MIDLSQGLIASLIIRSFACGGCLGVLYELVRLVRCMLSSANGSGSGVRRALIFSATFLGDLFFFVFFAVSGILITFEMCGGVFRGVVYLSMALGVLVYRVLFGKLTAALTAWLAKAVKLILKRIFYVIILPLRAIKFLIVKLYALTIGKIIGRIKERILIKRLAGLLGEEERGEIKEPTVCEDFCENGYKKEGRVSFGGKKGA